MSSRGRSTGERRATASGATTRAKAAATPNKERVTGKEAAAAAKAAKGSTKAQTKAQTRAYHQQQARAARARLEEAEARPNSFRNITADHLKSTYRQGMAIDAKTFAAGQAEGVRQARAEAIRLYDEAGRLAMRQEVARHEAAASVVGAKARLEALNTEAKALATRQAAANNRIHEELAKAYKEQGFKYTRPKTAAERRAETFARARENERRTLANDLYKTAYNTDATWQARGRVLTLANAWDKARALANPRHIEEEAARARRYRTEAVRQARAAKVDEYGVGKYIRDRYRTEAHAFRGQERALNAQLASARANNANPDALKRQLDAARVEAERVQHSEWLRLLREEGLSDLARTRKAPAGTATGTTKAAAA